MFFISNKIKAHLSSWYTFSEFLSLYDECLTTKTITSSNENDKNEEDTNHDGSKNFKIIAAQIDSVLSAVSTITN